MTITPVQTKIVQVPHLGGIDASTYMPHDYDPSKPTLVLINSFGTSADLYRHQYQNAELNELANLLAIELLGHGQTRAKVENFTYWDSAIMNLQVLDALKIRGKIFALGTSQGGWQTVRMALLAPERISGIIPLGTSMDSESQRSILLNCWDAKSSLTPFITFCSSPSSSSSSSSSNDFSPPDTFCNSLNTSGFGPHLPPTDAEFWFHQTKKNWSGDAGRKRARMSALNLRDRDGLHGRLFLIKCPVLWLHGSEDVVYSVGNARVEIGLFGDCSERKLRVIEGGSHYLNYSMAREVDREVVEFLRKYGGGGGSGGGSGAML